MSSSSNKSSKKSEDCIYLSSLPEDILVNISSAVAASSHYDDSSNLGKVSSVFRRISNEPYVLRAISRAEVWRLKLSHSPFDRVKFQRCLDCGNPEALFYEGYDLIFRKNERDSGMNFLLRAAALGHERSIFLAGILLISLGGEDKPRGYAVLSSFLGERVYDFVEKMRTIKREVGGMFWGRSQPLRDFKESYIRDVCQCNGKTAKFMTFLDWPTSDWDLLTVDACQICLWDHQIEEFYKYV